MPRTGTRKGAEHGARSSATGQFVGRGPKSSRTEHATRVGTDAASVAGAFSAAIRDAHGASLQTVSLIIATQLGLMEGAMRHINARVPARLLERATERAGAEAVTEVVTRALAGLATRSEIGPWLAEHWGALKDVDPAVTAELDEL